MQTGAREHQITEKENPNHIQLWQTGLEGEVWVKEQLINLGFHHILQKAPDTRYLMWVDSDILFEHDMLEKTIQALQIYPIVQCWSDLISLDSKGRLANVFKSYMYLKHEPSQTKATAPGYRAGS